MELINKEEVLQQTEEISNISYAQCFRKMVENITPVPAILISSIMKIKKEVIEEHKKYMDTRYDNEYFPGDYSAKSAYRNVLTFIDNELPEKYRGEIGMKIWEQENKQIPSNIKNKTITEKEKDAIIYDIRENLKWRIKCIVDYRLKDFEFRNIDSKDTIIEGFRIVECQQDENKIEIAVQLNRDINILPKKESQLLEDIITDIIKEYDDNPWSHIIRDAYNYELMYRADLDKVIQKNKEIGHEVFPEKDDVDIEL